MKRGKSLREAEEIYREIWERVHVDKEARGEVLEYYDLDMAYLVDLIY
jgi:hypothetical protein